MLLSSLVTLLLAGDLPSDVSSAIGCSDELPCAVSDDVKAGSDDNGNPMRVFHLSRGNRELPSGTECSVEEYWLVTGTKAPRKPKLFLQLCNDGYGSAGVGEDEVKVKPNRLFHEQFGGAEARWSIMREFSLSPPELLTVTTSTFLAANPQFVDELKWSWDTFSGERTRFVSTCTDEGLPDLREELKARPLKSTPIPKVSVTKSFGEGGWKETSLGLCAARATFVWQGVAAANDQEFSMKVVALSDTDFVIELTDDVFGPGDVLQVWLGDRTIAPHEGCLSKNGLPASQWLVDLPSGQCRKGNNARFGCVTTELAQSGQTIRIRLKLPDGIYPSVTFGYSDSDDGKVVERTIGTSAFVSPQLVTLGNPHLIDRRTAICDVVGGALTPKRSKSIGSRGALFPAMAQGK